MSTHYIARLATSAASLLLSLGGVDVDRQVLDGWFQLLKRFADEAGAALGGWGALHAEDVACLMGLALQLRRLISMILIQTDLPVRRALRAVGNRLRDWEARPA